MKLNLSINNAEKKYDSIMKIIEQIRAIDGVEEIGVEMNADVVEIHFNVSKKDED